MFEKQFENWQTCRQSRYMYSQAQRSDVLDLIDKHYEAFEWRRIHDFRCTRYNGTRLVLDWTNRELTAETKNNNLDYNNCQVFECHPLKH